MNRLFAVLPIIGALGSAASLQAGATQTLLTPCTAATLSYYEQHPCSVGILNFSAFSFTPSQTNIGPSDSSLILTPAADPSGVGGGFTYSGFSVGMNQTTDYRIGYRFDIDPGPMASAADLGVDPPYGIFTITQSYCVDSFVVFQESRTGCTAENTSGSATPAVQTLTVNNTMYHSHLNFSPQAQNFGTVSTDFNLNGTGQVGGSGFDSVTGTTTVTPEPSTITLVFAAFAAIGVRRKLTTRT